MKVTLLCNAGLSIESENSLIMIDSPNGCCENFCELTDSLWTAVCQKAAPYEKICGFLFTHDHPDHCSRVKIAEYPDKSVPVYIPDQRTVKGDFALGDFKISYWRFDHAPIPDAPPHVVLLVKAEGKCIYISADASLDCNKHRELLSTEKIDVAFWTPMYLSRAETRQLLSEISGKNYIYHMPEKTEESGVWKKCINNMRRYPEELRNVTVLNQYPYEIVL